MRTLLALIVATVGFVSSVYAETITPRDLPHIIYLLADDLGFGDPGCYNADSKIPTPNIDRLAKQGMRFTDVHSPSAVCTPTRYGILTGRYCWRTRLSRGVLNGYDRLLVETDRLTLPKMLAKAGYETAGVGKWHLGLSDSTPVDYAKPLRPGPLDVGFGSYFGIPASLDMDPYLVFDGERAVGALADKTPDSKSQRAGGAGFWRGGLMTPGFRHADVMPKLTQRAVQIIERHGADASSKSHPLFLYFALSAPHDPWAATAPFAGKSKAGPRGDAVMQVDAALGEILDALDRAEMADDALVIFTSDNGGHWTQADADRWGGHHANGTWRGQKADIYEAGHRIPLVARWPGKIKPETVNDQTVCLVDTMATCAAIAGVKLPKNAGEDSFDFSPIFFGKPAPRGPLVLHSGHGLFALRDGDWKFVDGLGSGGFTQPADEKPKPGGSTGQLYNLRDDPGEQKNLFLEKPEIIARMKSTLEQIKRDGGIIPPSPG
jgi:arylsulfatase A-like enzyme